MILYKIISVSKLGQSVPRGQPELLFALTQSSCNKFFEQWYRNIKDKEYIALYMTSISTHSNLIPDAEYGLKQ
jgi:hypothetical protein